MKKRHLLVFALVFVLLMLALVGCGSEEEALEGKNVVTFELNGGTLDYKTSSTSNKINFAYYPGTYILDPSELSNYKLYRNEYNFTGWYTDKDCTPGNEWDFKTPFNQESLTLYAGWEKAVLHTYTLYYVDGDKTEALGSYKVSAGEAFDDWRGLAAKRDGYTPIGYFSDKELNTPWDSATKHPGGDADLDIPVYVDYIKGDWQLVDSYATLSSAIKNNNNVYLTADIDCGGQELSFSNLYSATLEGNGYKIANFTVTKTGLLKPSCSIFSTLGETAIIKNVSFEGAVYSLLGVNEKATEIKLAALAIETQGATVENVTITGALDTDYTGTLSLENINEAFFTKTNEGTVSGFTATITIGS